MSKIAEKGIKITKDFFTKKLDLKTEDIKNQEQQIHYGDLKVYYGSFDVYFVEVKTEPDSVNGAFFMETLSDANKGRPGWLYNLTHCDVLIYIFLNYNIGFVFNYEILQSRCSDKFLSKFKFVEQYKNIQNNLTCGYLVPIPVLSEYTKYGFYLDTFIQISGDEAAQKCYDNHKIFHNGHSWDYSGCYP